MAIKADRPDYSNAQGIDDCPPTSSGGGGAFPDYPGVVMDSILGIPFMVVNAIAKESTAENAQPGDHYVIIAGEFTGEPPTRKVALAKDESAEPIAIETGAKFSVLTGSYRVVHKIDWMFDQRGLGELVPFEPPYGPVMFTKVEGGKNNKARDLVSYK